jgi:hypothetical protein
LWSCVAAVGFFARSHPSAALHRHVCRTGTNLRRSGKGRLDADSSDLRFLRLHFSVGDWNVGKRGNAPNAVTRSKCPRRTVVDRSEDQRSAFRSLPDRRNR